jgi:enolase
MALIKQIIAREIIDSRANPTVETKVILDDGTIASASVPNGSATSNHESVEIRDEDPNRYFGKGVLHAVAYVNQVIGPGLANVDPSRQLEIDRWMIKVDGTEKKEKYGANTLYSISFAIAKATAYSQKIPLYQYINNLYMQVGGQQIPITRIPTPIFNVINGGKHGAGNLDFQEFHIIPSTVKPYSEAIQIGVELYYLVKKVLIDKNAIHSVGDEGGFAPDLYTNLDALEIIMQAVKSSQHQFGSDIFLGLDVAADNFYTKGHYRIRDVQQPMKTKQFVNYLVSLNKQYHLLLLEDALSDDDWNSWKLLYTELEDSVVLVGDDLLATNLELLKKAISERICGAILVKPNQAGTLTETLEVVKTAKESQMKLILSHRSGETNDSFIADLAVGVQSDYVKFGAPSRGERVAKYNRLLDIELMLRSTSPNTNV